jgi:hypothetical protein
MTMKFLKTMVTAVLLTGAVAGGALAADGVLSKDEVTPGSYCHIPGASRENSVH